MNQKWTRAADVAWEKLDACALLVNSKTGERWHLNSSGAALWKNCGGQVSVPELARALARTTRCSVAKARKELASFIAILVSNNLLVPAGAGLSATKLEFSAFSTAPVLQSLGLGHGPRTRPGPRGNSSPG